MARVSHGLFVALFALPLSIVCAAESTANGPVTSNTAPAAISRDDLPLWEAGLAIAVAGAPDYPGAKGIRARALPLPYGIYRGQVLGEDDDEEVKPGKFSPQVEVDLSFSGALPADSDGNNARRGMPDLDFLLELGPQLTIWLARPSKNSAIALALPARAVFSTDFDDFAFRGVLFAPELSYINGKFARRGWNTRLSASSSFATAPLMRYFYDVRQEFVREGRPAYSAHAGYLESSLTASVSRSFFVPNTSLFLFARGTSLRGATNDDSPLLKDTFNYTFGIGLAYTFIRSERTVSE